MLGFALGSVGLSYDDFCRCTPDEFVEVCKAWHSGREALIRDGWERIRWQTQILILPYVNSKTKLPLPWDKEDGKQDDETNDAPRLTREAQLKRMAEVWGRVKSEK